MEGSDGKLYKVDLKKYGSEVKEVYGVTQSQIATYDSPLKSSMTKTRPTSGKTMNVRPASSKYLWGRIWQIKWIIIFSWMNFYIILHFILIYHNNWSWIIWNSFYQYLNLKENDATALPHRKLWSHVLKLIDYAWTCQASSPPTIWKNTRTNYKWNARKTKPNQWGNEQTAKNAKSNPDEQG